MEEASGRLPTVGPTGLPRQALAGSQTPTQHLNSESSKHVSNVTAPPQGRRHVVDAHRLSLGPADSPRTAWPGPLLATKREFFRRHGMSVRHDAPKEYFAIVVAVSTYPAAQAVRA